MNNNKITKNKKIDISDKEKTYIFSIILLSILFCVSLVYNFLGGFDLKDKMHFDIQLGDNYTIKLNNLGTTSVAFVVSGSSLPGDKIKQNIQIVTPDIDISDTILRVKIVLKNEDVNIDGFDSWQKNTQDFYYYYTTDKYKNQSIGLCSEVVLPSNISLEKDAFYTMNVIVELLKK